MAADLAAVQIAQLTGLNRNTVNRVLGCLRERMAEVCELEHPFRSTIEVDESYFGPRRVKGKAGRGETPLGRTQHAAEIIDLIEAVWPSP